MIQSIFTWFSSLDFGDLGQWAGAIATFIAVLVAMRQVKISQDQAKFSQQQVELSQKQTDTALQQTQLAIQQMEEARQREIEAITPELKTSIHANSENGIYKIYLHLTNIKAIRVHVFHVDILVLDRIFSRSKHKQINSSDIHVSLPKTISFGDAVSIEIPIYAFVAAMNSESKAVFRFRISTTMTKPIYYYICVKEVEYNDMSPFLHFYFLDKPANVENLLDTKNYDDKFFSIVSHKIKEQLIKQKENSN